MENGKLFDTYNITVLCLAHGMIVLTKVGLVGNGVILMNNLNNLKEKKLRENESYK